MATNLVSDRTNLRCTYWLNHTTEDCDDFSSARHSVNADQRAVTMGAVHRNVIRVYSL
jgi:hypothetical protein